jgi:hypothetical protein
MCVNNSTVAKRHPSAEQILDGAGNVIGEVSLDLTDCRDGCGTATLSFKKDKESPVICVFRKDDSVGQTRVGRSDGISFSGRVIELKKISGTYWSNGKFDVLTIEVTATSRGQKPKYGRRAMLSVPSTTTNAPADPEPMPEATAVGASEPPEPLKYFEVLLRNAPVDPPTLARVSRAAMEQSNLVSRVRLLTAYCLGQIGVGQDEMARRALDSLRKTAESDVDMAAPYLALTDLVTVRVICTACNGDKRMEKECATCAGNGQCRVCGGSAERAVNELGGKFNVACFTCNKTGKCKGCGGVGKVRTVCNTCQGRGDMIDRTRCLDIYRTFCLDGLRAR